MGLKLPTASSSYIVPTPDLTYPSDKASDGVTYSTVGGIDGSSGLVTALSLTGAHVINYLSFLTLTAESITIKLTIDGVVIWDDTFTESATTNILVGGIADTSIHEAFVCRKTFLLEIATTVDTSVALNYLVRPIL